MLPLIRQAQFLLDKTRELDFLAPLLLRLYLVPIFWMAGTQKLSHFSDTVEWFGNNEWGLGLPFPELLTTLAISAELGGAVLLTLGLAVRWVSIPLMITMLVAAFSSHWHNGWLAIASGSGLFSTEKTIEATRRLDIIKDIVRENGNYEWLTEQGSLVILNNGIEFSATYFIMLLALFFIGAGKHTSMDFWIRKYWG